MFLELDRPGFRPFASFDRLFDTLYFAQAAQCSTKTSHPSSWRHGAASIFSR